MSNRKILVIEDNQDNYELVRFLLEHAGHEVIAAFDGVRGLHMAHEQLPDLILLDLAIPEMDGWKAAKVLKEDPETQNIPLVALTAHTLPDELRRAMEAGCDGYIAKPINVETFSEEVDTYLQG
jgi:CheY-like chemotaxis protein